MDENIFPNLENDALVAAMNALRENETPETQGAFINAAVKARYFAPVDVMDGDGNALTGSGKMEVPQGAKFNFKLIINSKGEKFFPLFTDIAEFQKWSGDAQIKTLVVVFPQMASLVNKRADAVKGFVLNPMSQNLIFPKELLDNMLKHAQEQVAKAQAAQTTQNSEAPQQQVTYYFGKTVNIPDSVVASLKKTIAKNPEVNSAYLIMMKQGTQEHYMFVLDIEADAEKSKKIADTICSTAKLFLTKFPIVACPLNSEIGANAPKVDEPFYTKA